MVIPQLVVHRPICHRREKEPKAGIVNTSGISSPHFRWSPAEWWRAHVQFILVLYSIIMAHIRMSSSSQLRAAERKTEDGQLR